MTTEQKRIEDYFPGTNIMMLMSERARELEHELVEKLANTTLYRRDIGVVDDQLSVPAKQHNELVTLYTSAVECLHVAARMIAAMKIVDEHRSSELEAFEAMKGMVATHECTIRTMSQKTRHMEVEITRLAGELEKAKKPASTPTAAVKS